MATTYTLFPPVIDTYAPAFVLEEPGSGSWRGLNVDEKFYFKISQFNNKNEIGTSTNSNKSLPFAVEVTIKDIQTNEYVFNDWVTEGVKLYSIILAAEYDENLQSYYIRLPFNRTFTSSEGRTGKLFNIGAYRYYQMQLRFLSREVPLAAGITPKGVEPLFLDREYNTDDIKIYKNNGIEEKYLSEWSSVCLIRAIEYPTVKLTIPSGKSQFDDEGNIIPDDDDSSIFENQITNPFIIDDPELTICGKIDFKNGNNAKIKEYLKSYQLKFYLSNGTLMQDSGIIEILDNSNEFTYPIEYLMMDNKKYYIKISFTTNNLYSFEVGPIYFKTDLKDTIEEGYLNFKFPDGYVTSLDTDGKTILRWDINSDIGQQIFNNSGQDKNIIKKFYPVREGVNNTGEIDILIYWNSYVNPKPARLTIYRSDLRSGFLKWEKILENEIPLGLIGSRYAFNDTTSEDGVWYKYAARIRTGENYEQHSATIYAYNLTRSYTEGLSKDATPPVMSNLDNMYLISENKYLMIKLNPTVNSVKVKTIDSITETLGSKYPFVRRNGVVEYRQLQIGGLISRHMDENQRFADEYDLYNKYYYLYERYNDEYNINDYNDFIYERLFREQVIEFLHNGKPKLLRSPTEGVLLVKLTDISLTPNQQLGRMIYSFTATATEIDECSIDNFIKYDILDLQKNLGFFFVPVIDYTNAEYNETNYAENDIAIKTEDITEEEKKKVLALNNIKYDNNLKSYILSENNIICPKTFPETVSEEVGAKDEMNVITRYNDGETPAFSVLTVYEKDNYHSSLEELSPYVE